MSNSSSCESRHMDDVTHLRWDYAKLDQYYELTRQTLQPVYDSLCSFLNNVNITDSTDVCHSVDQIYQNVVDGLRECAHSTIPKHTNSFYKFWWTQELNI